MCEDAHRCLSTSSNDNVSSKQHKKPYLRDADVVHQEADVAILSFSTLPTCIPATHLHHPATVPAKEGHCPLLALCPEIRDRIYEFLLISPTIVSWKTHGDLYSRPPGKTKAGGLLPAQLAIPSICRTSQLLRKESLAVFFGRNRFILDEAITHKWLWRFSDDVLEHMQQIRLDYYFAGPRWWRQAVAPYPGTPMPPREDYTVVCDITLTRCQPWFTVSIACVPTEKASDAVVELKTKVEGILRGTLTAATGRSFNLLFLRKLWEYWILWSIAFVGEGKLEQAMVNRVLAKTFRRVEGTYSAKDLEILAAFRTLEQPKSGGV